MGVILSITCRRFCFIELFCKRFTIYGKWSKRFNLANDFQKCNWVQNEGAVNVSNVAITILTLCPLCNMLKPLLQQLHIFSLSWLQNPSLIKESDVGHLWKNYNPISELQADPKMPVSQRRRMIKTHHVLCMIQGSKYMHVWITMDSW